MDAPLERVDATPMRDVLGTPAREESHADGHACEDDDGHDGFFGLS